VEEWSGFGVEGWCWWCTNGWAVYGDYGTELHSKNQWSSYEIENKDDGEDEARRRSALQTIE